MTGHPEGGSWARDLLELKSNNTRLNVDCLNCIVFTFPIDLTHNVPVCSPYGERQCYSCKKIRISSLSEMTEGRTESYLLKATEDNERTVNPIKENSTLMRDLCVFLQQGLKIFDYRSRDEANHFRKKLLRMWWMNPDRCAWADSCAGHVPRNGENCS
ncbi:hypothetical protein FRX31_007664 [Thalictrum thalictroides]|uniref:Uncharacterized protein n=1 Tax=Thalictrum thalictroides TaxID=46969 RepID=A0A7J6WZ69_THATH|nr:hypothetical protein FRX31_007664 [Thalictrum thalictroides]